MGCEGFCGATLPSNWVTISKYTSFVNTTLAQLHHAFPVLQSALLAVRFGDGIFCLLGLCNFLCLTVSAGFW